MTRRLQCFLIGLTSIDLAFVQNTGIVAFVSMLPMWSLALLSPLLRPLQRFTTYGVVWNLGVIVLFALLAYHARSTGLTHLLEDGLLLAALCQVHLLNNIGPRQHSDLVFLNSLLIVFVTSFFGSDELWLVLFTIHALVFVPALQARVSDEGGGSVRPPDAGAAGPALRRTTIVAATTAIVFVLCPRDFDREGFLQASIAGRLGIDGGIGDRIRLDHRRAAALSDAVVMRIAPEPPARAVPPHWRCVALTTLENGVWLPPSGFAGPRIDTDPSWTIDLDGSYRRPLRADGGSFVVTIAHPRQRRLPLPLEACELELIRAVGMIVDPRPAAVLALARLEDAPAEPVSYRVRQSHQAAPHPIDVETRQLLVTLPPGEPTALTDRLLSAMPANVITPASRDPALTAAVAASCVAWLRRNRTYALPGQDDFAPSFADFCAGTGAGHCEYFASALALMLRRLDVPCRVIGGYLADERDGDGTVVVRARHAHAWIEALMPDGTWITLDATPPAATVTDESGPTSWWQSASDRLGGFWRGFSAFDATDRRRLFADILAAPRGVARTAHDNPLAVAVLLALPGLWFYLRRRQRCRPLAVATLLEAAHQAGLELQPGETPRELLDRARTRAVTGERIAALAAAVRYHEHHRYRSTEEARR
ncbi:MAG: transglutaminase domain-containing protein [Planctomycetes bacterium]|nr:transglutaminase domain-containing protein [Planctomycetota bacterium]